MVWYLAKHRDNFTLLYVQDSGLIPCQIQVLDQVGGVYERGVHVTKLLLYRE